MSTSNTITREAPSVVYKVTKVTGGRAPKTEVTIRIGGDVSKLKKTEFTPLMVLLREEIQNELGEWNE